jgi:hypothetical protein
VRPVHGRQSRELSHRGCRIGDGELDFVGAVNARGARTDLADAEGQAPLALVDRWAGKDLESTLRDDFTEQGPPGTVIEARRISILEARYPNGGGMAARFSARTQGSRSSCDRSAD